VQKHKWYNEIVAWASGAEIEWRTNNGSMHTEWKEAGEIPNWHIGIAEFRIKPQPKEPQYLYVYKGQGYEYNFSTAFHESCTFGSIQSKYIGKIKLENNDGQ
jgi:hypothetical protein